MKTDHIKYFIQQVEKLQNYKFNGHNYSFYRPVVCYVIHRFTGMEIREIGQIMNISYSGAYMNIVRTKGYASFPDTRFIASYQLILNLFIVSCRKFINQNRRLV